jgi:serine/threonine protein phosphatase 1
MTEYLYAIGDIHGCAGLLEKALAWIDNNASGNPTHIVFMGDYIDRGPDSKAVLDILMAGPRVKGSRYTCLRGNHEQMCLDSQLSSRDMENWRFNGGDTALRSFGGGIGEAYRNWMSSLPYWHEDSLRIFVHAGLLPGIPLVEQDPYDMMWIRERFFRSRKSFGKHVVHGHTPVGPTLLKRRTNIDTGAYHTGQLCVAGFLDSTDPRPSIIVLVE